MKNASLCISSKIKKGSRPGIRPPQSVSHCARGIPVIACYLLSQRFDDEGGRRFISLPGRALPSSLSALQPQGSVGVLGGGLCSLSGPRLGFLQEKAFSSPVPNGTGPHTRDCCSDMPPASGCTGGTPMRKASPKVHEGLRGGGCSCSRQI